MYMLVVLILCIHRGGSCYQLSAIIVIRDGPKVNPNPNLAVQINLVSKWVVYI